MKFLGYRRPDGRVGVRNHLAVIPSVFCANHVAEQIAQRIQGAVALTHGVGCSQVGEDLEQTARTLILMGRHPNVGAVMVVGLGCERFKPKELYEAVKDTGKMVEMVTIQEAGGTLKAIEQGFIQGEIQEAAYQYQRAVERKDQVVVGLNAFQVEETIELDQLKVDPAIETEARQRLAALRSRRDAARACELLTQLSKAAHRSENLMPLFIEGVENDLTLGEICNVLRGVWGEYQPPTLM
jgi:altronate dehydratase